MPCRVDEVRKGWHIKLVAMAPGGATKARAPLFWQAVT